MAKKPSENEIKQNHNHPCECGCSAAYDQIDDKQFEKAFEFNVFPVKHMAIAAVILIAMIAAIFFLI